MKKQLYQWNFVIEGLIPHQVKLKRKVWLKEGEVLLDKKGDRLHAYLLGDEKGVFDNEEKIIPYLWVSCLITSNAPNLKGGGGAGIESKEELGTKPVLTTSMSISYPEEAISDIEKHAYKFLRFIGKLHDKYILVISENEFIKIALDYFYEAEKKFVYSNEGFISTVISMEALFNEEPTDVKYKLSHRAAFLLSLCEIDPIEAFEKLKDSYNKRSTLIHGRGSLSHDPDRYLISKYTRKSIIIFLILLRSEERRKIGNKKRKESLLKEIDYAMLDENKRKSLKKEISKGIKEFMLPVPRTFEGEGKNSNYRVTAW
ncbi:MAG: HEPN domain-containing protein [Proteobacteria bacterium]|nr:HEPN domain-containing protein [Pseudomonadota bacterium]